MRQEDELSQARTERDFLLTFEPLNVETDPASTNMLLLLFKMAVVWKEKKEKGEVDSSLRLVLFLGLVRQCIKQITTRMEQPEDLEQLATLKFLRKKDGGTKMEWPYTPTPALDHTELMTPLAKVLAEKFPPPTADYPRQPRKPQTGRPSPGRENAPKHSAGLIMKEGDQQSDLDPVQGMLQALLRLHLHNPRNLCYAYATLHMFLCQGMVHNDHIGQDDLYGQLRHPMATLRQAKHVYPAYSFGCISFSSFKHRCKPDTTDNRMRWSFWAFCWSMHSHQLTQVFGNPGTALDQSHVLLTQATSISPSHWI